MQYCGVIANLDIIILKNYLQQIIMCRKVIKKMPYCVYTSSICIVNQSDFTINVWWSRPIRILTFSTILVACYLVLFICLCNISTLTAQSFFWLYLFGVARFFMNPSIVFMYCNHVLLFFFTFLVQCLRVIVFFFVDIVGLCFCT